MILSYLLKQPGKFEHNIYSEYLHGIYQKLYPSSFCKTRTVLAKLFLLSPSSAPPHRAKHKHPHICIAFLEGCPQSLGQSNCKSLPFTNISYHHIYKTTVFPKTLPFPWPHQCRSDKAAVLLLILPQRCSEHLSFALAELEMLRKKPLSKRSSSIQPLTEPPQIKAKLIEYSSSMECFSLPVMCSKSCNFPWMAVLKLQDIGSNKVICLRHQHKSPL